MRIHSEASHRAFKKKQILCGSHAQVFHPPPPASLISRPEPLAGVSGPRLIVQTDITSVPILVTECPLYTEKANNVNQGE